MKYVTFLFLVAMSSMHFGVYSQANTLYGLLRTSNPASVYLGKLNVSTDSLIQVSPNSLSSVINLTGAALDPNTDSYFFLGSGGMLSVGLSDGLVQSVNPLSNPIAPSFFDNFRFNTSDSSLYGLARRYIQGSGPGGGYGELFLSTIDPATGIITQISPQSVGETYALSGNAIDPQEMVYYYKNASQFIGLDMYTGLVYSAPTITFPQGGLSFDNFTYNCDDNTIYGLIRFTTTPPLTVHFGKINPVTGVVTKISQLPLSPSMFSVNGSSTIDPATGTYYYVSSVPQVGIAVVGVSLATGEVVSESTILNTANGQTYFDMIRNPNDCIAATRIRPNPNQGNSTANVEELSFATTKVFPNPVEDVLQIESMTSINSLVLRDTQGKEILKLSPDALQVQLNLVEIKNGVYFLEVETSNGIELIKVMK